MTLEKSITDTKKYKNQITLINKDIEKLKRENRQKHVTCKQH